MAKSNIANNTHLMGQHQRLARGEAVTGQTLKAGGIVKGKAPVVRDTDHDGMKKGGACKPMKKGGKC